MLTETAISSTQNRICLLSWMSLPDSHVVLKGVRQPSLDDLPREQHIGALWESYFCENCMGIRGAEEALVRAYCCFQRESLATQVRADA